MKSQINWISKQSPRTRALMFLILFSFLFRLLLLSLLIHSHNHPPALPIPVALFLGSLMDLCWMSFIILPGAVINLLVPVRFQNFFLFSFGSKIYWSIQIIVLCVASVLEIFFFQEFLSRFNFIAVDYLLYTSEVIRNAWESYRAGWVLFGVSFGTLLAVYFTIWNNRPNRIFHFSKKEALGWILLFLIQIGFVTNLTTEIFNHPGLNELSKNGIYSIFSAYKNNDLSFGKFYPVLTDRTEVEKKKIPETQPQKFQNPFLNPERKPKNVIYVLMESMSFEFLKAAGNTENLTPNLDRLAENGIFFDQLYSTGTRTVRGIEATVLSAPPTPGQSIVRRSQNKNFHHLGELFEKHGFSTEFLYGGYAYFDNMAAFFRRNDFKIIDRSNFRDNETHFGNAWGLCDEDLFDKTIRIADAHEKTGHPFFEYLLTTSNHRPFTYPAGKVAIKSGSTRQGAVQYSDYAIGDFLRKASTHSWFNDTLFVFVADHNANVAGSVEIPVDRYHIPVIFYAPHLIRPIKISDLASQIDVRPTLHHLMGWEHELDEPWAVDLLNGKPNRTLVSNFQKVALLNQKEIAILSPIKKIERFEFRDWNHPRDLEPLPIRGGLIDQAIATYQSASELYESGKN